MYLTTSLRSFQSAMSASNSNCTKSRTILPTPLRSLLNAVPEPGVILVCEEIPGDLLALSQLSQKSLSPSQRILPPSSVGSGSSTQILVVEEVSSGDLSATSSAVEEASGPPALFPMTEEEDPGSFSVNLITREEAPVCSDSSTPNLAVEMISSVDYPANKLTTVNVDRSITDTTFVAPVLTAMELWHPENPDKIDELNSFM